MSTSVALVDLDGTLTDPADGIIGGFQHALACLGAPVPVRSDLRWVIGPPLRQAFPKLLPDPSRERVEAAVAAYREYYRERGIYEATVYEGIGDALTALRAGGWRLLLCTVKPRVFAGPVIDHFALASHFDGVYGAELDGRFEDKADLMEHIVGKYGLSPRTMIMIGDRGLDMSAARRNGIAGIGVAWGYGERGELEAAGARRICDLPAELAGTASEVMRAPR